VKRHAWCLIASLALLPPIALAQGTHSSLAPADEYFGRLEMSFIGINNTFHDMAIAAGDATTDPAIVNKVDFAMEALNVWQNRYPHDSQLARSYFLGETVLKKIWLKPYQEKAWAYMQHIVSAYPNTFFGRTVKAQMTKGFTANYFAPAVPCSDPPPPLPEPTSNGMYTIVVHQAPCIVPTPTPSPSPSPTVAPTVTPALKPVGAGAGGPLPTPSITPSPGLKPLGAGAAPPRATP